MKWDTQNWSIGYLKNDIFSCGLPNDDQALHLQSQSPEEEEEGDYTNNARSQLVFATSSMTGMDFLTPGGLNLFTVALPAKTEKLVAKDLPKIIKASGMSKKNYG